MSTCCQRPALSSRERGTGKGRSPSAALHTGADTHTHTHAPGARGERKERATTLPQIFRNRPVMVSKGSVDGAGTQELS